MTVPLITVGIAGGTGAGKSTLAKAVFDKIGGDEHVTHLIHDSYYKDITHMTIEERAKTNFDHPDSLDTSLLVQHIRDLKRGQTVEGPTYDFATHSRTEVTETKEPKKIILVEGILIFTDSDLVKELDMKVYVEADSDIRLIRRLARDTKERGRTVEDVLEQYHTTVRPMHVAYVEPSKTEADLIVHSTGHSMEVAIKTITNHLRVEAGLMNE